MMIVDYGQWLTAALVVSQPLGCFALAGVQYSHRGSGPVAVARLLDG